MNKFYYILFFSMLLYSQDHAGYAGSFTENGNDARSVAMGSALTAGTRMNFPAYYNPSLVASLKNKRILFSHQFLTLDRRQSTIGVSLPLPPIGGISVGWIGSGVNDIQSRDLAGNKGNVLSAAEDMIMISFGIAPVKKLAIGGTVKILNNRLPILNGNISASGIGFDFGANYHIIPKLNLGIVLKNLNASYQWSNEIEENLNRTYEDQFPVQLRTGIEYAATNFTIVGDAGAYFINQEYLDSNFRLGIEYILLQNYFFRGGYRDGKFSMGIGLELEQFKNTTAFIDYAIVIENIGGLTHILSYALNF